ncbi:MAG: nickel-dependent hydrogenase large subunit [Desulfuromonadaceae bacterium]|nr:nickel-dependent hydrogenase large subunit [Desulfuromonadaceae bacterium]
MTINMLTRVEGHGSVELIRDNERVVDARLNMYESPRLFEALLVGRRFDEIADIACRICSICSTVHKVAALQAVEQAMGVTVSQKTTFMRELAVQGGQIESHALHIFCLVLPDYLGVNGFHELAAHAPEKLQVGLRIKKLGNLIQETVGGRAIHPFNLLVGGVGNMPGADQLYRLSEQLSGVCDDVTAVIEYICGRKEILPPLASTTGCAASGGPPLFGDCLITTDGQNIPASRAAVWLNEQVESHTNAKISRFDGNSSCMVGPLARLMVAMPPEYARYFPDTSIRSSLKARAVELKMAVERALLLIGHLRADGLKNEPPKKIVISKGEGASIVEAPRGSLLHRYRFDSHGICTAANIITPTAINQRTIARTLLELVNTMDGADYDQIKSAAEILIRCYDPCISCAVH